MSNRIAVFEDGVIQQLASPEMLYEEPRNAFVAYFIGENNRLRGRVRDVNGTGCTVDLAGQGGTVKALNINTRGQGSDTTLSLRPERVSINPPDGSLPNIFDAKVEELIYLGDHIRTRVNVCNDDQFVIKIPNAQGHAVIRKGETVRVGWAAEDCRALDA
jgi:putative spermidine/putrescine transport system ATP-binding protein